MSLSSEPFREEVFLFVDLKSEELVITSPLVEKGLLMGQDRIRVDLVPLFDSLSRDGYEVRLHDTSDELEIHDSQAVQTRVLQGTDYGVSVIVEKKALFQTLDESVESTLLVFFVALAGVGLLFHLTTLVFSGRLIEALEKQVDERTKHLRARTLELEEVNAHLEEEIEARQRAESEGEAKKAMIAELGHDIRTPLGGMSGLLQLLERESLTGDQEELVSMLRRSVLSLDDLLGNVLERAKLESGQVSPSTRAFSPLELTEEVVFLLDPLAKEKNLDLKKVQVKGPVPRQVVGDPHRLRQILTNLLSNAIKYTKEGSVTLSIERLESKDERSWLSFSIEDTGPGMESNQIPKLFDPFIRGLGEDQKSQGTGLGLSLVKGMVELMDGEIEVSSLQGEGTTFNVRLPFQELK